jgi:hypothetical protein
VQQKPSRLKMISTGKKSLTGSCHPPGWWKHNNHTSPLSIRKRWASRLINLLWKIAWDMCGHRMKVVDKPDSQSLLAQMTVLDKHIQAHFHRFHEDPAPEMQQWFAQPVNTVAHKTLDLKQQWLEMVDSAWKCYQ